MTCGRYVQVIYKGEHRLAQAIAAMPRPLSRFDLSLTCEANS